MSAIWQLVAYWDVPMLAGWARRDGSSLRTAWATCPEAAWLLYHGERYLDRRDVVRAACDALSATAVPYAPEHPVAVALGVARAWVRGDASADDCRAAIPSADQLRAAKRSYATLDGVRVVLAFIADGRPGVIHNAGYRAAQAGGDAVAAAAVRAALPLELLVAALGSRLAPEASLWEFLALHGEEPREVRWALAFRDDLAAAWAACRVPPWLLAIAVARAADPRDVAAAVVDGVDALTRDLPADLAAALDVARRFGAGSASADEVDRALAGMEPRPDEAREADAVRWALRTCADVREAPRAIERTGAVLSPRRAGNEAEEQLADVVRRRIPVP
jgi:hypothetical protein